MGGGGIFFERLLTKYSNPEELFGPLSLSALERDEYIRNTDVRKRVHCYLVMRSANLLSNYLWTSGYLTGYFD